MKGGSVAASRSTANRSFESSLRHSDSVFSMGKLIRARYRYAGAIWLQKGWTGGERKFQIDGRNIIEKMLHRLANTRNIEAYLGQQRIGSVVL